MRRGKVSGLFNEMNSILILVYSDRILYLKY
jgi:hypothetical protein